MSLTDVLGSSPHGFHSGQHVYLRMFNYDSKKSHPQSGLCRADLGDGQKKFCLRKIKSRKLAPPTAAVTFVTAALLLLAVLGGKTLKIITQPNLSNILHSLQFAKRLVALLAFACSLLAGLSSTYAQTTNLWWNGGGNQLQQNTSWSTNSAGAAASGTIAPTTNYNLILQDTAGLVPDRLGGPLSAASLISSNTTLFAIGGSGATRTFTLGSGGITVVSTSGGLFLGSGANAAYVFTINFNLIAAQTWSNATTLRVADNITNGGFTLTVAGAGTTTLGGTNSINANIGIISGSGGLVKNGTGTLILGGTNTFTGDTVVNAGTLLIRTNLALQNSALNTDGAGSIHVTPTTLTFGGLFGSGNLVSTITSGYSNVTALTLKLGTNVSETYSGTITNGAAGMTLTKSGAGTQVLSGSNSYTGATAITTGALRAANDNALGTTAAGTTVSAGAALELTTNSLGQAITIAEAITNSGTIRNLAGDNTLGGLMALGATGARIDSDAGTLSITDTGTISGATFNLTLGGAGNINLASIIGTTTGTLTKDGAGIATLSGVNTFTGLTTVSGGSLVYGTNNVLSTGGVTVSGGVFDIGSFSDSVGTVTLTSGSITGTTGVLTGSSYAVQSGSLSAGLGSSAATMTKTGAGTVTLSASNAYTGLTTISAGALRASDSFALGTTANGVTVSSGAALELEGGLIIGAESLALRGTGSGGGATGGLRNISGDNTYGGLITLGAASRINSDSGTLTLNVASGDAISSIHGLTFGGAGNITVADDINSSGTLTKDGAGTLTLSAANRQSGLTTVSAGTLAYGIANALAAGGVTVSGGVFDIGSFSDSVGTVTLTSGSITGTSGMLTSTAAYAMQSGSASANLAGAVGLNKTTAGTVTLSGSNSYTGATAISAGVLRAANNNALGTNAAGTTVSAGAALELTTNSLGQAITIAEAITNSGTIRNLAGDNTLGGLVTLGATGARIDSDDGTLSITNTGTILGPTFGLTLGGAGNVVLNSVIGTTTGAVTKDGVGTVTLGNAANTYGGVTTIGGGVLRVGTLAAAGTASSIGTNATITITDSGVLDYTGATVSINRGVNLAAGSGGIAVSSNAAALTISGVLSNTGSLVKSGAGTLILSASNTYTGTTTISNGTLLLSGSGTISTNGLDLAASGATLNISNITATNISLAYLSGASGSAVSLGAKNMLFGGGNASTTFAGAITGSGNLTKNGTGTTTLSGANTYTGSAIVSGGTLQLNNASGSALGSITNVTVATNAVLLVAQSNQVNNSSSVSLSGGTIRTGAGVTESFGNLTISSDSFLDFGATFGNASSMNFGTYTPSALLTIDNFNFGSTMTFGSDLTDTINNSSSFTFTNGGIASSSWNAGTSTFTITAIPEPSTYLAAAGLLGLMLWPSRKRLLKDVRSILGLRRPMRDRLAAQRES